MLLSKMLQKLLPEKNLTPSKLSRLSGISTTTIHGWQNGRAVQDLDALKKVATILQTPVHVLLYGEPDPFETASEEVLKEIFSGDIRVTLHRIDKVSKNKK